MFQDFLIRSCLCVKCVCREISCFVSVFYSRNSLTHSLDRRDTRPKSSAHFISSPLSIGGVWATSSRMIHWNSNSTRISIDCTIFIHGTRRLHRKDRLKIKKFNEHENTKTMKKPKVVFQWPRLSLEIESPIKCVNGRRFWNFSECVFKVWVKGLARPKHRASTESKLMGFRSRWHQNLFFVSPHSPIQVWSFVMWSIWWLRRPTCFDEYWKRELSSSMTAMTRRTKSTRCRHRNI